MNMLHSNKTFFGHVFLQVFSNDYFKIVVIVCFMCVFYWCVFSFHFFFFFCFFLKTRVLEQDVRLETDFCWPFWGISCLNLPEIQKHAESTRKQSSSDAKMRGSWILPSFSQIFSRSLQIFSRVFSDVSRFCLDFFQMFPTFSQIFLGSSFAKTHQIIHGQGWVSRPMASAGGWSPGWLREAGGGLRRDGRMETWAEYVWGIWYLI